MTGLGLDEVNLVKLPSKSRLGLDTPGKEESTAEGDLWGSVVGSSVEETAVLRWEKKEKQLI